jgi:hypothetical protein
VRVIHHGHGSSLSGDGTLQLRTLGLNDEAAFRSALDVMAREEFTFGFGLDPGLDWGTYLKTLDDKRLGIDVPDGWVPDTFLVADVAGTIVGRTSIRHELNESLKRRGGHIGYSPVLDRLKSPQSGGRGSCSSPSENPGSTPAVPRFSVLDTSQSCHWSRGMSSKTRTRLRA